MKKRILVTGGAGFIGSHLCAKLLEQDNFVICLDNLSTGSKDNIADLQKFSNFEFVEHDVIDPIDLQVDQIYNLACPASPPNYQKNPVYTLKTLLLGALNMLELAKKNNATILQASTSEVYGDPTMHPQKEEYWGNVNPVGVRSCYDEGKRCSETLMMEYHRQYSTDVRIVRIFNTYGPHMDVLDGRVVSNFIVQALIGEDITVYGDGQQTRSFCYVEDLVKGLIKMMNNPKGFVGPLNLGNDCEKSVLEIANLVIKLTNSSSVIVHKDLPSDDPVRRKPDLTLAKENFDWEPKIDINDGLLKTIDYFKKRLSK